MLELTGKLSLDRLRDRNQPQFTITQIRVSAHPDPAAPDGTWERPAVRTDIEDFALSTLRTSAYPMWPSPAKTPAGRASTRPSPSPANSQSAARTSTSKDSDTQSSYWGGRVRCRRTACRRGVSDVFVSPQIDVSSSRRPSASHVPTPQHSVRSTGHGLRIARPTPTAQTNRTSVRAGTVLIQGRIRPRSGKKKGNILN